MRPLMLGFVRVNGAPAAELELTGRMAGWAFREGYVLGVTYREQPGNGAFESLLQAITRHGAAGVIVPSFEHLGPHPEARVRAVRDETGVSVYAVEPTADRSGRSPARCGDDG
ncbi:hypothetical protein JOF29_005911 [Kribbella aluminosa]|uniref:Recombinase family protein n=1 Tax=Kribbella aluminosa TaxID=416017 RepID=A0ABS4UT31_9ACTN|nr:hypothetical protein [Kribbella aluminosa]MBP2354801.1 hypothetical protein [Kribbella aluminosa]